MDTDDLSTEAYNGILREAEIFNHDLTLRFGMLSYKCDNEAAYLSQAKKLCREIKILSKYELDDLFFGSPPDKGLLNIVLEKILNNIIDVEKIPENKRKYDF